jgi:hypothetical protein
MNFIKAMNAVNGGYKVKRKLWIDGCEVFTGIFKGSSGRTFPLHRSFEHQDPYQYCPSFIEINADDWEIVKEN